METMTDILSDKEPEKLSEVVAETPVEVQTEESDFEKEEKRGKKRAHQAKEFEAQGRDPETGQYIQKEEKKEEVKEEAKAEVKTEVKEPKQEFTEKERAFLRGLEEERKKRQALEAELAQFRQKKEEKPEEKKTFWDDPEGHIKNFEQRMAQREVALTMQVSERIARSKYQDFDEKISEFAESLKTTPGLHAQWLASPDAAEFAYRHGQRIREIREVGNIDKFREKIEKETRAKMEVEFKAKQEEFEKQKTALPSSLSEVKGAAKQNRPVWTGPTPFEEILKP